MKTGAALVLSVAGILAAGSAALAVNTQVLNVSPTGTGNANTVLLPNAAVPAPPPVTARPKAAPPATGATAGAQKAPTPSKTTAAKPDSATTGGAGGAKPSPAKSAPATVPGTAGGSAAAPSSSGPGGGTGGGVVTVQPAPVQGDVVPAEPGDDKGGLRKAPEPGDDSGGHGADD